jgi:HSP20 family molecular chaperone IbpA
VLFDDDFDEFLGVSDFFDTKFLRRLQQQVDRMMEDLKSGKMKGAWEVKRFDEPGLKGFYVLGRFGTDEALEPLEPLRPTKRRPLPENPFDIPKLGKGEVREPLTDVFEEENATRVYVELPGVDREDIRMNVVEGGLEIKAGNFHKVVRLPKVEVDAHTLSSEYKNGVLVVTVPKKRSLRWSDRGKARMV